MGRFAQNPDSPGKPAKARQSPLRESEAVDNDSAHGRRAGECLVGPLTQESDHDRYPT